MSPCLTTQKWVSNNKVTDLSLLILKFFKCNASLGAPIKLQCLVLFHRCLHEPLFTRCQLPKWQSRRKLPENQADKIFHPCTFFLVTMMTRGGGQGMLCQEVHDKMTDRERCHSCHHKASPGDKGKNGGWMPDLSGTPITWQNCGKLQKVITWSLPQKIFKTEWENWRRQQLLIWLWCQA